MKRILAIAACVLTWPGVAAAQEADAAASYEAALATYKDQIRSIEELWSEYQTADKDRQNSINEELRPLVAEAKVKLYAMTDAAVEAFRANPMADPEITEVLLTAAGYHMVGNGERGGGDQYERALPILEALVDGGHDKPELPVWGAMAAVCCNEFDLADKFAKIAIDTGAVGAKPGDSEAEKATFAQAISYLQGKDNYRARWEAEEAIRAKEATADNNPRVKLTIGKDDPETGEVFPSGEIVIELFEDQAPIATANFLTLAKDGFYEKVPFHRVLSRFMAQGGDPTGSGSGGPGYAIECECFRPDARGHFRGTLSMAHAGRNTGGSQFFLCFVPTDFLDGSTPGSQHTVFGRVVEGIESIGEIQVVDPQKGGARPDLIVKAEVLRDRGHAYEFKKLPSRR